jgi:hypothetical protein
MQKGKGKLFCIFCVMMLFIYIRILKMWPVTEELMDLRLFQVQADLQHLAAGIPEGVSCFISLTQRI